MELTLYLLVFTTSQLLGTGTLPVASISFRWHILMSECLHYFSFCIWLISFSINSMQTRSGKSRAGRIIPTGANKIKVGEGCLGLDAASTGIWEWERPGREIVGSSLLGYHFHRT